MKYRKLGIQVFGGIFVAALTISGCGGGGNNILTISPVGPTVVEKGSTLQFTANQSDVTWSVDGGSGNGTISAGGLYTPPSTLPVGEPEITVVGEDSDGDIAEASVSLRTADTITLGSPTPVNTTPLTQLGLIDFGIGFTSNRIAVGLGSVHEMSVFSAENTPATNLFLAQSLDFGSFNPVNLTNSTSVSEFSSAIELDSQLNPHILFARGDFSSQALMYVTSSNDQGANFEEAVPLTAPPIADVTQIMGFMAQDDNENLHVVFASLNNTASTGEIVYTRSADGGQSWSSPVNVATGSDSLIFPALAVNGDGSNVFVSFADGAASQILFSRSLDSGASFSEPIPLSVDATSSSAPFTKVQLDSTGAVYVALSDDLGSDSIFEAVVRKSTDQGASFSPAVVVNSASANASFVIVNMAIDDLDRIDFVWTLDPDNSGDADSLYYSRSVDGGATFGEPDVVVAGPVDSQVLSRGVRHDESGRLYIQYVVTESALMTGDIFVRRGE